MAGAAPSNAKRRLSAICRIIYIWNSAYVFNRDKKSELVSVDVLASNACANIGALGCGCLVTRVCIRRCCCVCWWWRWCCPTSYPNNTPYYNLKWRSFFFCSLENRLPAYTAIQNPVIYAQTAHIARFYVIIFREHRCCKHWVRVYECVFEIAIIEVHCEKFFYCV